jgi:hypothetical protein
MKALRNALEISLLFSITLLQEILCATFLVPWLLQVRLGLEISRFACSIQAILGFSVIIIRLRKFNNI